MAIINGILVTDVQLLDDEDGIAEEEYSDYQEEFEDYEDFEEEVDEAEVIRINNLLSDFGNIEMSNIP